jgi:hypothetical protein
MFLVLLCLQSIMPLGVMAGDRANGENWLTLCGDVFALEQATESGSDPLPSAEHGLQHCVFSQISGMAFLTSDRLHLENPSLVAHDIHHRIETTPERFSPHLRPPSRAPPFLMG